jgi:hypothetical protein
VVEKRREEKKSSITNLTNQLTIPLHCAVCKFEPATQRHHLSYDPEILIDVCVPCHLQIHAHQHGVGRGLQVHDGGPQLPHGSYIHMMPDPVTGKTVVADKDSSILKWMICSCGNPDFYLYADSSGNRYLACNKFLEDYKIDFED